MSKPEIIEKKPMNMVEMKFELSTIKKRDGELTFRGNKTEEYINDFVTMTKKDAKDVVDKLRGLEISRLKEEFLHKIVDMMPSSIPELKVVLQGFTLTLPNTDLEKIMGVLKEYSK